MHWHTQKDPASNMNSDYIMGGTDKKVAQTNSNGEDNYQKVENHND